MLVALLVGAAAIAHAAWNIAVKRAGTSGPSFIWAGIVVGAVIVAGALFGGGVLVGTIIPQGQTQSQYGPGQGGPGGGFQGGPNGNGGPGPVQPEQGQTDTEEN